MRKNKISSGLRADKMPLFGFRYFSGHMPAVDILLPVYNPLSGWDLIVRERFLSLQKARPDVTWRLVLVNDGTPGLELAPEWTGMRTLGSCVSLHTYAENKGKGFALREGVRSSSGDLILYTDIDWPYTEESMLVILEQLQSGSDAVIGIRDHQYYQQLPLWRRLISKVLRRVNGLMLRLKVNDTQAGLKGFRREVAHIFLQTTINRYLFDLEFIYLLSRQKDIRITAIPIKLREGVSFSTMNRKILLQEARNFMQILLGRKSGM